MKPKYKNRAELQKLRTSQMHVKQCILLKVEAVNSWTASRKNIKYKGLRTLRPFNRVGFYFVLQFFIYELFATFPWSVSMFVSLLVFISYLSNQIARDRGSNLFHGTW